MRQPMPIDKFDLFEIDDRNRLYWNGDAVVLERRLALDWYQTFLATIAALGAAASGVYPFLDRWVF